MIEFNFNNFKSDFSTTLSTLPLTVAYRRDFDETECRIANNI